MKLIVLDRDGVLVEPRQPFLRHPDELVWLPGALEALALLTQWGWRVVLAINQSAIGRGLLSTDEMNAIHERLLKRVLEAGGRIHAIFFCPHAAEDRCDCRKPKPGLLQAICQRFGVEPQRLQVVGDRERDLAAALAVGAQPWLVRTGAGKTTEGQLAAEFAAVRVRVEDDLLAVAKRLIAEVDRPKLS